jgi:predicted nucleotidyltransferase
VTHDGNPALSAVLEEFRRQLIEHFGSRLVGLTLFGSHARGEAGAESDIDVAVVLDRIDSHTERVWPMQLAGGLDGLVLVPIVLSKGELESLRAREDILAESLDREGIALVTAAA